MKAMETCIDRHFFPRILQAGETVYVNKIGTIWGEAFYRQSLQNSVGQSGTKASLRLAGYPALGRKVGCRSIEGDTDVTFCPPQGLFEKKIPLFTNRQLGEN